MKIIRYLLLMLLLLTVGLLVYIATQNASFKVSGSRFIPSQKATAYNYIADLKNWEEYASWNTDTKLDYTFSKKTNTIGSKVTFSGKDTGYITNNFIAINDSVNQKISFNDQVSQVAWKFKDTIGGTIVKWNTKGKLDFKTKVLAFFKGGVSYSAGKVFSATLDNINNSIIYEAKTFSVKVEGLTKRDSTYIVKKSLLSRGKLIHKNAKIIIGSLEDFIKKNKYTANGKPFILYNKLDRINDVFDISVCMPIQDSVAINANTTAITTGLLTNYDAVKCVLHGDYGYLQNAWNAGYKYIKNKKLVTNYNYKVIEILEKNALDTPKQSQWITQVYLPVWGKPTIKPKKPRINRIKDTTNTLTPQQPEPNVIVAPQ